MYIAIGGLVANGIADYVEPIVPIRVHLYLHRLPFYHFESQKLTISKEHSINAVELWPTDTMELFVP